MKNFYLYLILFIGTLIHCPAYAQTVSVNLTQPAANKLSVTDLFRIRLDNISGQDLRVILDGKIEEAYSGLIVSANTAVFTLNQGSTTIGPATISKIEPITKNYSNHEFEKIMLQTGSLPAGDYTICLYVKDESGQTVLGEQCITHSIQQLSPPVLLNPAREAIVTIGRPLFNWIPPSPIVAGMRIDYGLKMAEVLTGQSPESAIPANPAFFERSGIKISSFQFPAYARPLEQGKTYAWQITAYNSGAEVVKSEVNWFTYPFDTEIDTASFQADIPAVVNTVITPAIAPVITNWDFELGNYSFWRRTGRAFSAIAEPTNTEGGNRGNGHYWASSMNLNANPSPQETGTLISGKFTITKKYINFLVSHGSVRKECMVQLLVPNPSRSNEPGPDNTSKSKEVPDKKATASNKKTTTKSASESKNVTEPVRTENAQDIYVDSIGWCLVHSVSAAQAGSNSFEMVNWKVDYLKGQEAYIRILDNSISDYICADDFTFTDRPAETPWNNWDFERGDYSAWIKTGNAFSLLPNNKSSSLGNIGQQEQWYAASGNASNAKATGRLISKEFSVTQRFLTFLVGGSENARSCRVMIVESPTDGSIDSLMFGKLIDVNGWFTAKDGQWDSYPCSGNPTVETVRNELVRKNWDLTIIQNTGRKYRIVIDDASATDYIFADDFQFTDEDPLLAGPLCKNNETTNIPVDANTNLRLDLSTFQRLISAQLQNISVGYGWCIYYQGRLLQSYGHGYAGLPIPNVSCVPYTGCTRQNVMSCSKTVTAVAVLKLLEHNRISIDAAIGQYLPRNWPVPTNVASLSFRQMLSHNSRLTSQPGSSPIRGEMTYDSLRSGFCNPVLMTGSAYDNINLAIFRIIIPKLWALASPSISRAVGDTIDEQEAITYFDRFIQDSLLRPNQISGSIGRGTDPLCSFDYGQLTFSNRRITNQVSVSIADFEWQRKAGPFGMYLSPEGLCKFYSLLENGNTFLTENSKRQMKTPVSGTNNTAFGLGFNVMSSVTIGGRPRPMYGHNGVNLGGAQSLAVTIPELNIQVVLLTNTNIPGGVGTLQNALTSALQNSYR